MGSKAVSGPSASTSNARASCPTTPQRVVLLRVRWVPREELQHQASFSFLMAIHDMRSRSSPC